ncbi:MAG: hypothetical protein IPJ06_14365 [Saprospiraceae bacterium]|nr:hypothetical protein [Saprospiraceae bacterium]
MGWDTMKKRQYRAENGESAMETEKFARHRFLIGQDSNKDYPGYPCVQMNHRFLCAWIGLVRG